MDEYNNILLEEYFNQATTEERKREIRNEILKLEADDPDRILFELGEEVAMQKKVQQLASNIERIAGERKSSWLYLKVAASIVVVFLSAFAIYQSIDAGKSEEELFTEYFQPYPDLISVRLPDEGEADWQKALVNYHAGKYNESLSLFEKAEPPAAYREDVAFYHAMTLLALDKSEGAIDLFLTVEASKYTQQVRWYLALAYLQKGQKEQATKTLLEIQENDFQWLEAQELLKEID